MVNLSLSVSVSVYRVIFVIGLKITEDLANFFLLYFFFAGVFVVLILSAARGGEDHIVNEFVNALAIGIV